MLNGKASGDELRLESLRLARIILAKLDHYRPPSPQAFESDAHVIGAALLLAFGDGVMDTSKILGDALGRSPVTEDAAARHMKNRAAFYQTDSIH